jgi:membrane associated rhomboid family serine protease
VIQNLLRNLPLVTKNLLIINILMGVVSLVYAGDNYFGLNGILGLHYPGSISFSPFQIITHMFMHGGISHIFFNMFALIMFGSALEQIWGPKRFLIFYLLTGLGAVALHLGAMHLEVLSILSDYSAAEAQSITEQINNLWATGKVPTADELQRITGIFVTPTVGASGAIFGLLVGYGVLYPNRELMLIFLPFPIKAKYFIPGLILIELFMGVGNYEFDNIAHFAHLGGALIGFIIVKWWQKKGL